MQILKRKEMQILESHSRATESENLVLGPLRKLSDARSSRRASHALLWQDKELELEENWSPRENPAP